jgi:hypothetical protein
MGRAMTSIDTLPRSGLRSLLKITLVDWSFLRYRLWQTPQDRSMCACLSNERGRPFACMRRLFTRIACSSRQTKLRRRLCVVVPWDERSWLVTCAGCLCLAPVERATWKLYRGSINLGITSIDCQRMMSISNLNCRPRRKLQHAEFKLIYLLANPGACDVSQPYKIPAVYVDKNHQRETLGHTGPSTWSAA